MALDVHVVEVPSRQGLTGEWPACQFEEAIHSFIFHGAGVDIYSRFAYLRRMIDFYADASYSGGALDAVVAEIDDLLPHLSANQTEQAPMCDDKRSHYWIGGEAVCSRRNQSHLSQHQQVLHD